MSIRKELDEIYGMLDPKNEIDREIREKITKISKMLPNDKVEQEGKNDYEIKYSAKAKIKASNINEALNISKECEREGIIDLQIKSIKEINGV